MDAQYKVNMDTILYNIIPIFSLHWCKIKEDKVERSGADVC